MKIIFHPIQLQHNPAKEFLDGEWVDYLESVRRPQMILDAIQQLQLSEVIAPDDFGLAPIEAVHTPDYLDFLQTAYARWIEEGRSPAGVYPDTFFKPAFTHRPTKIGALAGIYTFDMSTVIVEHTWPAAYWSAQCALTAAKLVRNGERAAFALCRPPGHHAHANMGGGYCFINNAAVAAQWLLPHPSLPRQAGGTSLREGGKGGGVAILDIDFHHGNGTQAIFTTAAMCCSCRCMPTLIDNTHIFLGGEDECGAGEGEGFNLNLPLPIKTTNDQFLKALDQACERIVAYAPATLLISLGVDTFGQDPLGDFALTSDVYPRIGARLAQLKLPAVFLMEGGYAIDALGQNVAGVLSGFKEH